MNTKKLLTRTVGTLLCTGILAAGGAGAASAAPGQRPETFTSHEAFPGETFEDVVCEGEMAEITLSDADAVFHITEFADGRYHVTGTFRQSFTWTTQDGVTYTGHVTGWFGENQNSKANNGTFTLAGQGKGSDGSKVSVKGLAHVTVNAGGDTVTEFDRFEITCR
jgi:hypothetical protein